jgi:antitoxin component YwqK of YwqJK toxin-antitoxin module
MKRTLIPVFIVLITQYSCLNNSSSSTDNPLKGQPSSTKFIGENGNGVKRIYNATGDLETETPYKDSLPDGIQKEYFKTGQLFRETPLEKGRANGMVKEYSTSGKLYREMPVTNGKANGIVRKYYDNGVLFCEAPFVNGQPVAGLKEYNKSGKLMESPKMVFKAKDLTKVDGTLILEISLSDEYIQPSYSQILFFEGKEMSNKLPVVKGKGILKLTIPAGTILNKKLTFEAKYTTTWNNICIIRGYYSLNLMN